MAPESDFGLALLLLCIAAPIGGWACSETHTWFCQWRDARERKNCLRKPPKRP